MIYVILCHAIIYYISAVGVFQTGRHRGDGARVASPHHCGKRLGGAETKRPYKRQESLRRRRRLFCFKVEISICNRLCKLSSSLRRGNANLLCIVPILADDPRRESL